MLEQDTKTERKLAKAWKKLNEGVIMPEAGLTPFDSDVRDAEVVGKASTLEQINMLVVRLMQSPAIDELIMKYLQGHLFAAIYCFKDLVELGVGGKTKFDVDGDGYDLRHTILKMFVQNQKLISLLDRHFEETDDENEYDDALDTDEFKNALQQKIVTLMQSPKFNELIAPAIKNLIVKLQEDKEEEED